MVMDDGRPVWRNVRTNELTSTRPDPAHILNEHRLLLHSILTERHEEASFRAFARLHQIEDSLDFLLAVSNYRELIATLSSDIWRRFGPSGCQALNIDESLYKKIAFHLRDGVVGIDTFGDLQKQVKQEMVAQMFHYTKWKADENYMPPKEEKEEKREKETQHKDFAKDRQREEQREKDTTHKEKERDRGDSKLAHSTSGRKNSLASSLYKKRSSWGEGGPSASKAVHSHQREKSQSKFKLDSQESPVKYAASDLIKMDPSRKDLGKSRNRSDSLNGMNEGTQGRSRANRTQKQIDLPDRLLLMGAAASGKSCFAKQCHFIKDGITRQTCQKYIPIIRDTCLANFKKLVLSLKLQTPLNRNVSGRYDAIMNATSLTVEVAKIIQSFWSQILQEAKANTALNLDLTQLLSNNDEYYFETCLSIAVDEYSPGAQDILRTYLKDSVLPLLFLSHQQKTVCIQDTMGSAAISPQMMNNQDFVAYFVSLSDFFSFEYHDGQEVNKMKRSLDLWHKITTPKDSQCSLRSFILVFTKLDDFKKKSKIVPLVYPPFNMFGIRPKDHESHLDYIERMFREKYNASGAGIPLHVMSMNASEQGSYQKLLDFITKDPEFGQIKEIINHQLRADGEEISSKMKNAGLKLRRNSESSFKKPRKSSSQDSFSISKLVHSDDGKTSPDKVSKGRSSPNLRLMTHWSQKSTTNEPSAAMVREKSGGDLTGNTNNNVSLSPRAASERKASNNPLTPSPRLVSSGGNYDRDSSARENADGNQSLTPHSKHVGDKRSSRGREGKEREKEFEKDKVEKRLSRGKEKEKEKDEKESKSALLEKRSSRGKDRDAIELKPSTEKIEKRLSRDRKDRDARGSDNHLALPTVTVLHNDLQASNISTSSRLVGSPTTQDANAKAVMIAALSGSGPNFKPLLNHPHSSSSSSGSIKTEKVNASSKTTETILVINKELESFVDNDDSCEGSETGRVHRAEYLRRLSRTADEARPEIALNERDAADHVVEMSEVESHVQQASAVQQQQSGKRISPTQTLDSIRSLATESKQEGTRAIRSMSEPGAPLSPSNEAKTREAKQQQHVSAAPEKREEKKAADEDNKNQNLDFEEERFFSSSMASLVPSDDGDIPSSRIASRSTINPRVANLASSSATHGRTASTASLNDTTDSLRSRSDSTSSYILRCEIPESISTLWSKLLIDDGTKLNGGHIDMSMEGNARDKRVEMGELEIGQTKFADPSNIGEKERELHGEPRATLLHIERDHHASIPMGLNANVTSLLSPPNSEQTNHSQSNSPIASPHPNAAILSTSSGDLSKRNKSPTLNRKSVAVDDLQNLSRIDSGGATSASVPKINLSAVSSANTESHLYLPPSIVANSPKSTPEKAISSSTKDLLSTKDSMKDKDGARHKHKKKERSRERDRDAKKDTI